MPTIIDCVPLIWCEIIQNRIRYNNVRPVESWYISEINACSRGMEINISYLDRGMESAILERKCESNLSKLAIDQEHTENFNWLRAAILFHKIYASGTGSGLLLALVFRQVVVLVGYFLLLEMEFAVLEECLLLLDLELALSAACLLLLVDTAWSNPLLLGGAFFTGYSLMIFFPALLAVT